MTDEPPPPGADEVDPPAPGVEEQAAVAYDPAAYASQYAAYAAGGPYPDYYSYYYSGYAGYGQYPGYEGYQYPHAGTEAYATAATGGTADTPAAGADASAEKKMEPTVVTVPLVEGDKPKLAEAPTSQPSPSPEIPHAVAATTAPSPNGAGSSIPQEMVKTLQQRMQHILANTPISEPTKKAATTVPKKFSAPLQTLKGARLAITSNPPLTIKAPDSDKPAKQDAAAAAAKQAAEAMLSRMKDQMKGKTFANPPPQTLRSPCNSRSTKSRSCTPSRPHSQSGSRSPCRSRSPGYRRSRSHSRSPPYLRGHGGGHGREGSRGYRHTLGQHERQYMDLGRGRGFYARGHGRAHGDYHRDTSPYHDSRGPRRSSHSAEHRSQRLPHPDERPSRSPRPSGSPAPLRHHGSPSESGSPLGDRTIKGSRSPGYHSYGDGYHPRGRREGSEFRGRSRMGRGQFQHIYNDDGVRGGDRWAGGRDRDYDEHRRGYRGRGRFPPGGGRLGSRGRGYHEDDGWYRPGEHGYGRGRGGGDRYDDRYVPDDRYNPEEEAGSMERGRAPARRQGSSSPGHSHSPVGSTKCSPGPARVGHATQSMLSREAQDVVACASNDDHLPATTATPSLRPPASPTPAKPTPKPAKKQYKFEDEFADLDNLDRVDLSSNPMLKASSAPPHAEHPPNQSRPAPTAPPSAGHDTSTPPAPPAEPAPVLFPVSDWATVNALRPGQTGKAARGHPSKTPGILPPMDPRLAASREPGTVGSKWADEDDIKADEDDIRAAAKKVILDDDAVDVEGGSVKKHKKEKRHKREKKHRKDKKRREAEAAAGSDAEPSDGEQYYGELAASGKAKKRKRNGAHGEEVEVVGCATQQSERMVLKRQFQEPPGRPDVSRGGDDSELDGKGRKAGRRGGWGAADRGGPDVDGRSRGGPWAGPGMRSDDQWGSRWRGDDEYGYRDDGFRGGWRGHGCGRERGRDGRHDGGFQREPWQDDSYMPNDRYQYNDRYDPSEGDRHDLPPPKPDTDRYRSVDPHDDDGGYGYCGRGRGYRGRGPTYRGRGRGRFGYSCSSPRRLSRSRSRSRSRSASGSRSRSRSRSRSGSGLNSHSRSSSPRRGGRFRSGVPKPDTRTKEEIAAEMARLAEAARQAALAQQSQSGAGLQMSRHARRVYVGGLPVGISEVELTQYFNAMMMAAGATTSAGTPVVSCYMNPEKRFAFVELRSVEETSNAMAFDNITCRGEVLKIRRPHDYNPQAAKLLGPLEPSTDLNPALVQLANGVLEDTPEKLVISGLPTYLGEEQVQEILTTFGTLQAFSLAKDASGTSCGYGYCEYLDPTQTAVALEGLAAIDIGGKNLTVRRASAAPEMNITLQRLIEQQQAALREGKTCIDMATAAATVAAAAAAAAAGVLSQPAAQTSNSHALEQAGSKVVRLDNMVQRDELVDDEEYEEILDDTKEEVAKYGELRSVVIPRPGKSGAADPPGVGLVFLEYEDAKSARRAQVALEGRQFGPNQVKASMFSEDRFNARDFS